MDVVVWWQVGKVAFHLQRTTQYYRLGPDRTVHYPDSYPCWISMLGIPYPGYPASGQGYGKYQFWLALLLACQAKQYSLAYESREYSSTRVVLEYALEYVLPTYR